MTAYAPARACTTPLGNPANLLASFSGLGLLARRAMHALTAEILPQFAQGGASVAAVTAISLALRSTLVRRSAWAAATE